MKKPTAKILPLPAPVEKPKNFFSRLGQAWAALTEQAANVPPRRQYMLPTEAKEYKIPAPWPGVIPKTKVPAELLASDSAISAMTTMAFGYGGWDQQSFMGYALLAELSQITEFHLPAEKLANEMTRKWGKLTSTSDDDQAKEKVKALEDEMARFKVRDIFNKGSEVDQYFGIGHIFIDMGTEGNELLSPLMLDKAKISKGQLKEFRVVEPMWTYPNLYNANDPLKPDFYNPKTWFVMGTEVHKSRLLRFISRPVPDMLKPAYLFGGISLTQLLWPYVENWLRTRQSVSDITSNFSTPVLKTDLDQMTSTNGAMNLAARAQFYNAARSNQGLLICDMEKEEFKIETASLAGLSELQNQAIEQMAFPASIPLVKLLGVTPSGLNASSDGEIRVFYDTIASMQERILSPALKIVIDILQLNLWGEIDPGIKFEWAQLWELDEEKEATRKKTEAETDIIYVEAGILDPQAVLDKLVADPNSPYAGQDLGELPEQPAMGEGEEGEQDLEQALGSEGPRQLIKGAEREGRGPRPRTREAGGAEEGEEDSNEPPRGRENDRNDPDRREALTGNREQQRGRNEAASTRR